MKCLDCQSDTEMGTGDMYAKCKKCKHIFMNVAGDWRPYPIDDATRQFIEPSLGFQPDPEFAPKKKDVPQHCTTCGGNLEKVEPEGEIITRCEKCGILSGWDGNFLMPIVVEAPGGGWNAEFQAIFEEKLGFIKKIRKNPPGVPD